MFIKKDFIIKKVLLHNKLLHNKLFEDDLKYNPDKLNLNTQAYIYQNYKLKPKQYFLINLDNNKIIRNNNQLKEAFLSINPNNIQIQPRIKGGFLKKILKFILKIFDPIIKPLEMIANAFMMIYKALVFMFYLASWMVSFMIWFLTDFLFSIPLDVITLAKRFIYIITDGITGILYLTIKTFSNKIGNITIVAMSGYDNVPDESKQELSKSEYFQKIKYKQKCYRTSDGLVPFSVIIATILCPPVGVFMEYGLYGWFNILICALLTLVFYFPGLIYALILLYC